MHRIGRTGRADQDGIAHSFVEEKDAAVHESIEALMNLKITMVDVPEEVEISAELIPYEIPEVKMKNQLTKAPTIAKNLNSDATKQTRTNTKKVLTRKARVKAKRAKKMKKW